MQGETTPAPRVNQLTYFFPLNVWRPTLRVQTNHQTPKQLRYMSDISSTAAEEDFALHKLCQAVV